MLPGEGSTKDTTMRVVAVLVLRRACLKLSQAESGPRALLATVTSLAARRAQVLQQRTPAHAGPALEQLVREKAAFHEKLSAAIKSKSPVQYKAPYSLRYGATPVQCNEFLRSFSRLGASTTL